MIFSNFPKTSFRCTRRMIAATASLNKASDPVQKLFLDKVEEYKNQSRDGKIVDTNPEIEREIKNELERVAKQFGGGSGVNMTQFPSFKFEDPQVDAISN